MDEKSRITGDCYVRICGSRGLKCPRPPDHEDELIDGLDFVGVASYLAEADEANVNLFI